MPIYYVWGFRPPAPHRLGNATRIVDVEQHDIANGAAANTGFDVSRLNESGTPAWATAYGTPDGEAFEPGEDEALIEDYIEAAVDAEEV